VSATEHGDQGLLDHALLPEDHPSDRVLGGGDLRSSRFRLAHDHVVELFEHFTAGCRHHILSCHLAFRLSVGRALSDPPSQ
jgi:hypothetical protein